MPRKGIHPMVHMVRIVMSNGASIFVQQSWQEPLSRVIARGKGGEAAVVATKFLEVDRTNHERFTGVPSRSNRDKLGRRAKFENKFVPGPTAVPPTPPPAG
jgi:ribosomal protein L31